MTRGDIPSRITIESNVGFGKPCIRGRRIWVALILELMATGPTIGENLTEYPDLSESDIFACLAYAAEMSRERYVQVEMQRNLG